MLRAVIALAACAAASAFAPTLPSAGVRAKTSAVSGKLLFAWNGNEGKTYWDGRVPIRGEGI
eukprot:749283-Hanusia_phi.AAC.4